MSFQDIFPCTRGNKFEGHPNPGYPCFIAILLLSAVNISTSLSRVLATGRAIAEYCLSFSLFKVLKEKGEIFYCAAQTSKFSAWAGKQLCKIGVLYSASMLEQELKPFYTFFVYWLLPLLFCEMCWWQIADKRSAERVSIVFWTSSNPGGTNQTPGLPGTILNANPTFPRFSSSL